MRLSHAYVPTLKEVPAEAQAGFEGYGSPVVASPFATFKPAREIDFL